MKKLSLMILICLITTVTVYHLFHQNKQRNIEQDRHEESVKTLSDIKFKGASVLPYTTEWQSEPGKKYFLLSQEAYGKDAGTWDDWGGGRDPDETEPVITAAREFTEESLALLGTYSSRKYIDELSGNTSVVIVNNTKRLVTYITHIKYTILEQFFKRFYKKRNQLMLELKTEKSKLNPNRTKIANLEKYVEKTAIGLISETDLKKIVTNAPRNAKGQLLTPIEGKVNVIDRQGNRSYQVVKMRPIFVSKLQSYFQGKKFKTQKNKKVRIYN